jgi:cytochrome c-type biogenesis protein CcmE
VNARKRRRIAFVAALLLGGAGAAVLVISALQDNVLYFYSPSDVVNKHVSAGTAFRVGGLVEPKSVKKGSGMMMKFVVSDGAHTVPVEYSGDVPSLFREGQGVVAIGRLNEQGVFKADQVLAKHDEKYMPPEVVDALKRSGRWGEGGGGV